MKNLGDGGAEKVLVTMLKHFDYDRYDVSLSLTSQTGVYLDEVPHQVKMLPVWRKPNTFSEKLSFYLYGHWAIKWVERLFVRSVVWEKFDTIVSFCQGRALKFHGYLSNKANRNVSWVHTDLYSRTKKDGAVISLQDEKKCYEEMDEVVFVSEEARRQFEKFHYALKGTSVVYNPIDREAIRQQATTNGQANLDKNNPVPIIVLCGRLDPVKAYDRMVRVAARLKEEGVALELHFIGEGPERENLEALIQSLNLSEEVKLLGFQYPPYPEIAKGDVFVSCSLSEGYPLNVCEALCLGLPVVATRCTGNNEILADGKYGMLVEQDDNELYIAVKSMLTDKTLRREYENRSSEGAKQFDMNRVMEKIYEVLG